MNVKDSVKVLQVVQAYNLFVKAVTGNRFAKVRPPKSFGKLWLNCVEVYNSCQWKNLPLYEYFVVAHLQYSLDWVKKTFQSRTYLPLSVVVSQKSIVYATSTYLDCFEEIKESYTDRVLRYKTVLRNEGYNDGVVNSVIRKLEGGD